GLATKANQSALEALQVEVGTKSMPTGVNLKLANHPTIAAMNSSITSANNATLATVAATYALKSVVDQLALDVAAHGPAPHGQHQRPHRRGGSQDHARRRESAHRNCPAALRPADGPQRRAGLEGRPARRGGGAACSAAGRGLNQTVGDVTTAVLGDVTQVVYDAGQALQDSRLDGHDAEILALQNAGPYAMGAELTALQLSLQSAIDGLLAEGNVTWDLLVGTNQIRNFHAASESWVLAQLGGYYTSQEANDAITAPLTNHFTRAEATANLVAFLAQANTYTDDQLVRYSTAAEMTQAIADALVPYGTIVQRDAAIAAALAAYYTSVQTDSAIAAAAAITAALVPVTLSNGQSWNGGPTFNLLQGTKCAAQSVRGRGAHTASFQNLDDTILIESDSYVDSKIITALLDFSTSAEVTQEIADALSNVDFSSYYTSAQTDSLCYSRTELDSLLTATLTQYWTSGRTQSEIDDALAGSGFLDQAAGDARYLVRPPGGASGSIHQIVQNQFFPPVIKNLLLRLQPPLAGTSILGNGSPPKHLRLLLEERKRLA
ncbi:unnamed protein product, partial [Symbiodinium sp. CCMP2456]